MPSHHTHALRFFTEGKHEGGLMQSTNPKKDLRNNRIRFPSRTQTPSSRPRMPSPTTRTWQTPRMTKHHAAAETATADVCNDAGATGFPSSWPSDARMQPHHSLADSRLLTSILPLSVTAATSGT